VSNGDIMPFIPRRIPHRIHRAPRRASIPYPHRIHRTPHRTSTTHRIHRTPHRTSTTHRIHRTPHTPHTPHTPQKNPKKTGWKDKIRSGLDWASTIGSLALTGYMGYEMLNGNEAYAEDYGSEDTGYEGYSDGGYGGGGYSDGGYGGGGYSDGGYGSDLGAEPSDMEDTENLDDFADNGESGYHYDPDTGEYIPDASGDGILDGVNSKIENLSDEFGIPKEIFYLGGAVAVAGGLYYLTKKV
jgi:hypothetical protein